MIFLFQRQTDHYTSTTGYSPTYIVDIQCRKSFPTGVISDALRPAISSVDILERRTDLQFDGGRGGAGAVRIYYRKSALDRATWLSSLYLKFYEAPDLKRIRKALDDNPPDAPEVAELVRNEDADLTDYLNFFEFMAYLEERGQLNKRDVAALFDYYLRLLSKTQRRARICN